MNKGIINKMKKAYILTFFYGTNYGSKLQATALKMYLESLGYDVCFIKTFWDVKYLLKHPLLLYTRIQNLIHRREANSFFETEKYEISEERKKRIAQYNDRYLNYITIKKHSQWLEILKEDPIFIAGSDIIWQPALGYPEKYFLDFAYYTKCKKFSYASSVGSKQLPPKYSKYYKKYLESFDAVSVRETATAELLKKYTDKEIVKVIDPTLLLSRYDWDAVCDNAVIPRSLISGEYILCYFVMNDKRYWEYINKVKEATQKTIAVLPMHDQDEKQPYEIITEGTPREFIWLIKNACFVVTDSFHASVFSYIYKKELYVLKRRRDDEDEKYNDLLTRYSMNDRLVKDETRFERIMDFTYNYTRLHMDQEKAKDFIKIALL